MKSNIATKYGLILFGSLALFFGIMWAIGQAGNTWLRMFNGLIHLAVLYFAISAYRKKYPQSVGNYLSGVGLGMYLSVIGSLLFALLIGVVVALDTDLATAINNEIPYAFNVLPLSAGLFVMMEGIVAGLIGSYIVVRIVNAKILKKKSGQTIVNQNYETNV